DSFLDIIKAAEELKKQRKIFTIDKDNKPKVLFYSPPPYIEPIDDEIKSIWKDLRVPDEADLQQQLEQANLKPIRVTHVEVKQDERKEKTRQQNRKIKITNTHLQDIDLSRDYEPSRG
ncbi:transcription factor TFIIE beta subunit, TFIIEB, Tfa2, partial [Spiromyces aspiralis]